MEVIIALLVILIVLGSKKLYSLASDKTKKTFWTCFWCALIIILLYISPYLDLSNVFKRSIAGGIAAFIVMTIYFFIEFLIGKSDKEDKDKTQQRKD